MQSRWLNPRWADKMPAEGYSGARIINRVVDYLCTDVYSAVGWAFEAGDRK